MVHDVTLRAHLFAADEPVVLTDPDPEPRCHVGTVKREDVTRRAVDPLLADDAGCDAGAPEVAVVGPGESRAGVLFGLPGRARGRLHPGRLADGDRGGLVGAVVERVRGAIRVLRHERWSGRDGTEVSVPEVQNLEHPPGLQPVCRHQPRAAEPAQRRSHWLRQWRPIQGFEHSIQSGRFFGRNRHRATSKNRARYQGRGGRGWPEGAAGGTTVPGTRTPTGAVGLAVGVALGAIGGDGSSGGAENPGGIEVNVGRARGASGV